MLQVSSNGLLSFGRSETYSNPVLFPNSSSYSFLVAPFWADHDPRPAGQISYEVHNTNTPTLLSINRYIRQTMEPSFQGTWMIVAEWNDVPEYGTDNMKVSKLLKIILCTH